MIVQRASERVAVPWRNGLGVQYEITCDGSLPDDWSWRLSTADITQDVPFSSFPGVTREFCVADGNGVVLNINGVDHRCELGSVTTFRGDDVVFATLIEGPMRALNLMVRDGAQQGSLQLNSADAVIASFSVAIAIGSSSILVSDDDQIDLQLLDALLIRAQKTMHVLQGVVVTF
jgi:environmental stress-induced protein Ves